MHIFNQFFGGGDPFGGGGSGRGQRQGGGGSLFSLHPAAIPPHLTFTPCNCHSGSSIAGDEQYFSQHTNRSGGFFIQRSRSACQSLSTASTAMSSHVCTLLLPHGIHHAQGFLAAWAEASREAWAVGSQGAWEGVDSPAVVAAVARCASQCHHTCIPGK